MNKNINFRRAVSILVLFLMLAGTHLFMFAKNVGLKYQITDLKIKLAELKDSTRAQRSLAASEEDLASIEKTAKTKLGMIYPENVIYIAGNATDQQSSSAKAEDQGLN